MYLVGREGKGFPDRQATEDCRMFATVKQNCGD